LAPFGEPPQHAADMSRNPEGIRLIFRSRIYACCAWKPTTDGVHRNSIVYFKCSVFPSPSKRGEVIYRDKRRPDQIIQRSTFGDRHHEGVFLLNRWGENARSFRVVGIAGTKPLLLGISEHIWLTAKWQIFKMDFYASHRDGYFRLFQISNASMASQVSPPPIPFAPCQTTSAIGFRSYCGMQERWIPPLLWRLPASTSHMRWA